MSKTLHNHPIAVESRYQKDCPLCRIERAAPALLKACEKAKRALLHTNCHAAYNAVEAAIAESK